MKMNIKEKKEQVISWVKEKKGIIILGICGITAVAITAIMVNKPKTEKNEIGIELEPPKDYDLGRDLEMHFVDPENGETLWKELCYESYMNDMKDSGMQYEAIRKLNGIDEEA